jgi:HK97 family phage prohead protease
MTTSAARLRRGARDDLQQVARDRLLRTAPFTLEQRAEGEETGDGLTLEGHAAVFNRLTLIDSWEGRFKEQCVPGCFKKTFRERTPVLQFDHGRHPMVGSIPIGMAERVEEDDVGAFVRARLHDNWIVQPVRDAIASGSINGMSFRFTVVRDEWVGPDGKKITDEEELLRLLWGTWDAPDDELLTRSLKEVKVPELGPVVFPAYEDTDVGVRSGRTVIDLAELRENPAERRRMARLLFMAEGSTPEDESSSTEDVPGSAPARSGHPDPDDDAPPAVGHPSDTSTTSSERDSAAEILGRMQVTLARVRKD